MWSFFNRELNKEFPYDICDRSEFRDLISVWNLFKAKKKVILTLNLTYNYPLELL